MTKCQTYFHAFQMALGEIEKSRNVKSSKTGLLLYHFIMLLYCMSIDILCDLICG